MGGVPWTSLVVLPLLVACFGADCAWHAPAQIAALERVTAAGSPEPLPPDALARRPEGDPPERGVTLPPGTALAVRLARPVAPRRLVVQGTGDDVLYVATAEPDGAFREVWRAPRLDPPGLRTRFSPRLDDPGAIDRLLVAAARERSSAVSDVRVLAPALALSRWTPVALVWLVWLVARVAARQPRHAARGARVLAGLRAGDALWAVAGTGFAVPGMALPAATAIAVTGIARTGAVRGAPPAWGSAATLAVFAVGAVQFALATRGTGLLLGPELLSAAYDALADSLRTGHSAVAAHAIRWEAFVVDGEPHMYFGPLPALLRLVPHALYPPAYGLWSRASCLLAGAVALAAFAVLAQRRLQRNPALGDRTRRLVLPLLIVAFGCGTPLLWLSASSSIYHESIHWALACSLWGLVFALAFLETPRALPLFGLATAAGGALLSRATFGAPLYAMTAVLAATALYETRRQAISVRAGPLALALAPAALLLAFQLWYNVDRFGSVLTFIDFRYLGYLVEEADSWAALERGGSFHPGRLPDALRNYFVPGARYFSETFPFVQPMPPIHARSGLYPDMFTSWVLPLTISTPWLLASALAGWVLLARTRRPRRAAALLCACALLGQLVLVMSYYIITERYTADFLPALVFAAAFLLSDARGRLAAALPAALAVLGAVSVLVSAAGTLAWIPQSGPHAPHAQKRALTEAFGAIDARLP